MTKTFRRLLAAGFAMLVAGQASAQIIRVPDLPLTTPLPVAILPASQNGHTYGVTPGQIVTAGGGAMASTLGPLATLAGATTSAAVTSALGYAPVNRAGDVLSGSLAFQGGGKIGYGIDQGVDFDSTYMRLRAPNASGDGILFEGYNGGSSFGSVTAGGWTLNGPLTQITGVATVSGSIGANSAGINTTLSVGGATSVGGGLSVGGNANVVGAFGAASGTLGSLTVTGNANVSGLLAGANATFTGLGASSATVGALTVNNSTNVSGLLSAFAGEIVPGAGNKITLDFNQNGNQAYLYEGSGNGANLSTGFYQTSSGQGYASSTNGSVLGMSAGGLTYNTFTGATVGSAPTLNNVWKSDGSGNTTQSGNAVIGGSINVNGAINGNGANIGGKSELGSLQVDANAIVYGTLTANSGLTVVNAPLSTSAPVYVQAGQPVCFAGSGFCASFSTSSGKLVFLSQAGTRIMSLDNNGNLTVSGNIYQNGTP